MQVRFVAPWDTLRGMMHSGRFSVAVIGGGVAGLGVGWRLAQAGAAVTIFDVGTAPARQGAATWAAAGMICARLEMTRAAAPLAAFALSARAAWPAFASELDKASGMGCGYIETGAMHIAYERDAALEREGVDWVDAAELKRLEPAVTAEAVGGWWAAREALADPRWTALSLVKACQAAGVVFAQQVRVNRIMEEGGRAYGVRTPEGVVAFDHIVLAAGAWSGGLLKVSNLPGPGVRPVKGQLLSLAADPRAMPVRRIVWTDDAYIAPHADGRIVIGATQEDAGFDAALDHARIDGLRAAAQRAAPALAALREMERFCGFRPASDDGLPVLGGIGPEGLTLASGQFRNGILFAPLIADAAAQHVLQGRLPEIARPFAAGRFAEAPLL